jgi:hypothetical protein
MHAEETSAEDLKTKLGGRKRKPTLVSFRPAPEVLNEVMDSGITN